MHIDELVLVQTRIHQEVDQGHRRDHGLNHTVDQPQEDGGASIGNLPAIVYILVLPQPCLGALSASKPGLNVEQDQAYRGEKSQSLNPKDGSCKLNKTQREQAGA